MPGANAKFRFRIKYEYKVGDKKYINNKIAIGGEINSGRIRAEKRQEKYPEGSMPLVYYNPTNPDKSCLEPIVEGGGRFELLGGLFGIILGILLLSGIIGQ